ncbi:MAG: adenosylcobinamide-phosphate synthase CbiB [Actinobacteria bacterium]|nr:adenosylcobinamide-phosphate synthase CbiB [Actinomycetota bacterium]
MKFNNLLQYFIIFEGTIILGFIIDLIFGDPEKFPHPVKGIGFLALKFEPFFRKRFKRERMAGTFFALSIIFISFSLTFLIIFGAYFINVFLAGAVAAIFICTSIAIKDLKRESLRVENSLKKQDIAAARKNLSMIVGRDTENLTQEEIMKATIETISENLVDGILSPLFFAFIGSAPLAIAYKASSTLDSTVGYKNKKYKYFGTASAKIDDFLNFIPARISIILIPVAAFLCKKNWRNSFRIALRDRKKNPSPNSGIAEAAFAGALGIQIGGLNYYNGIPSDKPKIGSPLKKIELKDIIDSLKITYAVSILFLLLGVIISSALFFSILCFLN